MELLTSIAENTGTFLAAHTLLSYLVLFFGSYFETLIGVGFFVYGIPDGVVQWNLSPRMIRL